MNNYTQKISDLLDALPKSVQMVIYDGPLDNELGDIANEYQISETDIEVMRGEILLVILDINKPETLEQTLIQKTAIDKQNMGKLCSEINERIILPLVAERNPENNQDRETVLNDIENPPPTKPIVLNPAGSNPILDAQHNLPEQEKKILISSAAVPSRGPMLGNFGTSFGTAKATVPPITVRLAPSTTPIVARPATSPIPPTPPISFIPPIQKQSTQPTARPIIPPVTQPQKPPQTPPIPAPPAPDKYKIDPYREATE
jgi:hypothetical protein